MQDEIQLPVGRVARVRGVVLVVGIAQPGGSQKTPEFTAAPEGVEIPGYDDFLVQVLDEIFEVVQLVLSVSVFQREVYNKNGDRAQVGLDDQPLDPLFEIVETIVVNALFCQHSIALLVENGYYLGQRVVLVLVLDDVFVPQGIRDELGLAEIVASIRAGVDLQQGHDVRVHSGYKVDYPLEIAGCLLEETGVRNWQVIAVFMAGAVSYIVKK